MELPALIIIIVILVIIIGLWDIIYFWRFARRKKESEE